MHRSMPLLVVIVVAMAAIGGLAYAQSGPCNIPPGGTCRYLPISQYDPTPTPVPPTVTPAPPSVHVRSYRMVTKSTGSLYIYGEIENTTTRPAYLVKVTAKFYNAAGAFIATDYTYTFLDKTEVNRRNPFELILTNPPSGITRVDFSLSGYTSFYLAYAPASVISQQTRDNYGLEVFGEVRNDQGKQLKGIEVAATFYDAAGNVYFTDFTYADTSTLNPGETSVYSLHTSQKDLTGLNFEVQAQGYFGS